MYKSLKVLVGLLANVLIAGGFGMLWSLCNSFWLEYAIDRFPAVAYNEHYLAKFSIGCGICYLAVAMFRVIQSRGDTMFPRGLDMGFLCVLTAFAMVGFTPVPNSHFVKYLIEHNHPGVAETMPATTETNAVPGGLN